MILVERKNYTGTLESPPLIQGNYQFVHRFLGIWQILP